LSSSVLHILNYSTSSQLCILFDNAQLLQLQECRKNHTKTITH